MKKPGLIQKILVMAGILIFAISSSFGQTQTFTTSGTFTVPAGVTSIIVECWGAGGAGGGNTTTSDGGGGGGGGAYSRSTFTVTPGSNYIVTVGAAGSGSTSDGTDGGDSWFNTSGTIFAKGGQGGFACVGLIPGAGGAGGASGGCIGSIVYNGGSGGTGRNSNNGQGGPGGSSAGIGADGTSGPASWTTVIAEAAPAGGGIGGNGGTSGNNGSGGTIPGGGGGGSGDRSSGGPNRSGGDGANGQVIVSWTQPVFFSQGSGDPNILSNWKTSGGYSPANFTTNYQTFAIQNGHTMTTSGSGWTVSGTNTIVEIQSGGRLTETTAISLSSNITLQIDNGGTLNHNVNSVTVFGGTESFGNTSSVNYGYTGTQTVISATYGNLTISGSGTKTLGGAATVNGTLTLTSGTFAVAGNTLTLNGPTIAGTPSNLSTTSSSSLVFGGTSAGVLIPANVTTLNSLSITNTNIVALQSSLTISGTFNPSGAGLSIGANTLTLNGQINCGTLTGGATSNMTIGGSGSASLSAVTLNNLTINRAVSMCGNITVGGTLTLTSGAFTVGAYTLTINGPTIAGTPSNLTTSSSSNLVFGGISAGISVPSSTTNLNNLTVNNASGITLTGNVTVGNILTMTQGNITTGANTLTLSNSAAGSLARMSGTIIGRIRRAVNTPLSVDYIFPIGTAAFYRPAIMNFSSLSAGTNITVEFIATPPSGFSAYTDDIVYLNNPFTEGYWRFSSSGLPAATYTLGLTANGFTSHTIDGFTRITGRDNTNTAWRALGAHGTQSGNDVSRNTVTNLNTTSFDFTLATGCTATSLGYRFERIITIDYTKVAGGINLYNFPVLVNFTGQNFLKTSPAGQIFNGNGFDIIFTDENYNKLDHQLEYYDGTNGDLIAWIRIPTLSCTSNTVIKILYGNQLITTDPSVTSVWDSHYKGVWHLDNNSLNDFTSFNKAGTPYNSPTYPGGMIYNSLGLNGSNQYVEVLNAPNINFAGNMTVSAWVYMNAGNRDQKIAGNQNNSSGGYKFGIYTNNKVEFEIRNAANTPSLNRDVAGGTVLSTGQWYYLAGISSDVLDSIKTFVNGIPERPFKKTGTLGIASDKLTISKEPFQSSYYFSGRFDELRVSDKVRSNGWMRTEYNNQSSPSTFYTLDAVEVISNNLPSAGLCTVPITLAFGYPSGGTYSGNPYISGNVFTPPAAGTYSITYTYNAGCGPVGVTKNIIITDIPPPPAASNMEYCTNQITYLEATSGENIRWYSGGTLVSTANPFSTGQTTAGTYNYTVTQTINGCESTPASVSLTIFNGITINNQPQPATICANDIATFSVIASGYNLSYRWQENGVNISDGGIYSGATTPTLTLTNPGLTKNGKLYRCVITTSCGASPVNSTSAVLTIITDLTWTGTMSSEWNVSGNWSCGLIPTSVYSIQIPDVSNKPVLSTGVPGTVNNLTIETGSSLTVSGNTLQISGSITNNGTFNAYDGTIELNGSAAQIIGPNIFDSNTIKNLTINNSVGASLLGTLNVTGIVSLQNGNLASDGFLTLVSDASQTALIEASGTGTVTGNTTMQRYLPSAFGYKYVSSPFQAATVNEFDDEIDLSADFPPFYSYDESSTASGWVEYITPTDPLEPLTGYAANFGSTAVPITADITGVVNNGALSVTLYNQNNPYTLGFNLVGNPYPSPIDWDASSGWTKTTIDNALYYFKASTSDEYGGTYSTYINGVSSDGLATRIIPSMQGFFVHVTDGSYPVTGTLGLNNSVRVTDLTHPFLKSGKKNSRPILRIGAGFADNPSSTDPLAVYFDEKAEAGFDPDFDALKLMNTDYLVPNLYAVLSDGTKLSINALPETNDTLSIIPLGLKTNMDGYVVFKLIDVADAFSSEKIYITDIVAGTENNLLDNNEYTIYLNSGQYKDRFFLNLTNKNAEIPEIEPEQDIFSVYSSHGIIKTFINTDLTGAGTFSIINLTGQKLFVKKIYDPGYKEFFPGLKNGIYIITFVSPKYMFSKKIFIQNR